MSVLADLCRGVSWPRSGRYCWLLPLILGWAAMRAGADPATDFFESNIRPVLAGHCYSCHSAKAEQAKGGLRLDTRDALLKGGDSGPALVPGDPEQSLLIKAVRYTDEDLQMPPKNKKLSAVQIAALEQWIQMGAPDPRTGEVQDLEGKGQAAEHWAFQPVRRPALPEIRDPAWVQEPLDAFVLAKLEEKGLRPAPKAGKRTLLRRVTFALTGLPPSPEEVSRFLEDDGPDAFETVVDRLLASPQYGERWARHWLDVARYADTKGYVFEEERRYPYAYTYRDYVIRAFNEDLPFDQFLIQQIAADQLPIGEDKRPLAALGYLTLGRRFLNNPHDIIDDRIDVVTRGMMGLTVSCARCHDHKYDPISAKDYYSLYGVFASSTEPEEKPVLGGNELPAEYAAYREAHQSRLDELNRFQASKEAEVRSQLRQSVGEYLLAARDTRRLADASQAEGLARERKLHPGTVRRWVDQLDVWAREPRHPVFGPWLALAECSEDGWAGHAEELIRAFGSLESGLNPLVRQVLTAGPLTSIWELADRYSALFGEVDWLGQNTPDPAALLDPSFDPLREILFAPGSPTAVPETEITRLFDVPSIQKLRALKRKVEELDATHPGAPPRAMALEDKATPHRPRVFIRGNPGNPGPEVPRQFLEVLSGGSGRPFEKGSGRLELGQAIASQDNPLTARVLVNRVWLQHFGTALVRTPSDFGLRSEPPSHPELLDYLAGRFMDEGWSLKKLHRWIVLSSTYQQASENDSEWAQADPANQWFWRANRRRLDLEAMRDSLLTVAGRLDLTLGGQAVDLLTQPFTSRRTVYGFIERQNLPGFFRTFDFASPDTTSPQRFLTTVPQQALFLINSPFVVQQAVHLIHRDEVQSSACSETRVKTLYQIVYQRPPSEHEMELALAFLKAHAEMAPGDAAEEAGPVADDDLGASLGAWERYAQVLLMSNEFVFVD